MIRRNINILKSLENSQSVLLFGPRGTGKSTLIAAAIEQLPRKVIVIDLLKIDQFRHYLENPSQLRQEISREFRQHDQLICVIDEIQKVPSLLDEVHSMIETYQKKICFILTGSSARKLKREGANLLAGRAIIRKLHPFSSSEVDIDTIDDIQFGTLPKTYLERSLREDYLRSYVSAYIKEEILQESLVRKVESFSLFLDLAAQLNGEPINFTKLAKQIKTHTNTVQTYFQILEDTLLCSRVSGWAHSVKKQMLQAPKFYFFDNGVLNAIAGELRTELKPQSFRYGRLFETFIVNELIRRNDDFQLDFKFFYWRTSSDQEVDLVLSKNRTKPEWAIEIKSSSSPCRDDVKALLAIKEEYPHIKLVCLCRAPRAYEDSGIEFLPWREGILSIG
jgi:predicted AAA+ superfamily ATPase